MDTDGNSLYSFYEHNAQSFYINGYSIVLPNFLKAYYELVLAQYCVSK